MTMHSHLLVPRRLDRRASVFRSGLPQAFDDLWRGLGVPEAPRSRIGAFHPSVDISETDEEIRLTAELPGLGEEDFEVTLDGDRLTIKGEKKDEREEKEKGYHRVESLAGTFQRSFRLPADVDPETVTASYDKGVLTVTVPKPEEAQPQVRSIPITTS
jgi:HSP20 family protein